MTKKVMLIVLDSLGVGELPDASLYGDEGSNTLANIALKIPLKLNNLQKLGLGNIIEIKAITPAEKPMASYGKMAELSPGKDTTTGHWEMTGIVLDKPFPVYPNGFPQEIILEFERRVGRKTLGNVAASGTEIIQLLGEEHLKTGQPIVYTSADSVFQIAAHEEVIPLEELYSMCSISREILQNEHAVGRVIARPFIGEVGNFIRTSNRHDYSLVPSQDTTLDLLEKKDYQVFGVGKIKDIFAGKGISKSFPTKSNDEGVEMTIKAFTELEKGLVFTNLVEFDSKYGHRNDISGYAQALENFDVMLPKLLNLLEDDDILIITADHGCDPTTSSTDHSREYVPLLIYGNKIKAGINLGIRKSFADLGATICDLFGISGSVHGESFYNLIRRG